MRKLGVALALALPGLLLPPGGARADDPADATATMTCDRVEGPGRVRCEVEAHVGQGEAITWGDVVLEKLPPFAGALRGRIGPHDATKRDPGEWRWALALVARERGSGQVEGVVRVVVCRADACAPREIPVTASVVAGQ